MDTRRFPSSQRRNNPLRITEQIPRVDTPLHSSQPIQVLAPIIPLRRLPLHLRIRVVDVHPPFLHGDLVGDITHKVLDRGEALGGVSAPVYAVVEEEHEKVVAVGVGGGVHVWYGNG